ncbi:MAG: YggS family pyridoxal phosphate-dependent enzyme [Proteobacteria bacterium]|nr:YggS family pyridoxal phosphate-dependent enzyme [Pseudomonadota bacterium]
MKIYREARPSVLFTEKIFIRTQNPVLKSPQDIDFKDGKLGIRENLARVKDRIEKAAIKAGRDPQTVRLVVVSKTVEIERIQEAIHAGVNILGENYVQEARDKIDKLGHTVEWHFIGHLQTNKAKYAVDLFDVIHSIDRVDLAQEIDRIAVKKGKTIPALIQVNISGEESKHGIDRDGLIRLISEITRLKNIMPRGLMTMPPYYDDPEMARPYFQLLRNLKEEMNERFKGDINLEELSMGMSNDFEIAIEEGATLVRIGTAIFGERQRV